MLRLLPAWALAVAQAGAAVVSTPLQACMVKHSSILQDTAGLDIAALSESILIICWLLGKLLYI